MMDQPSVLMTMASRRRYERRRERDTGLLNNLNDQIIKIPLLYIRPSAATALLKRRRVKPFVAHALKLDNFAQIVDVKYV
jgi:hypothetical protein